MVSPEPMLAIEVKGINKAFGDKVALNNLNFSVPKGKIFGFLGPNGAGKTTTIRLLMDFIRADSGNISILGQDASLNSADLKQSIGYLSSDSQFYGNWSSMDHLKFFESLKGENPVRDQLISRLDLDLKTKVKTLSSGNKQKLAILLCFAGNPEIVIMDEPTRGLDPLLQNELYDILLEFASQGKTVFLSSHNLGEVERICDSVVLIKDGSIVEEKTINDIRDLKIHNITASFSEKFDSSKLKRLDNIEIVSNENKSLSLKVHGDLNAVIAKLADSKLTDLSVNHLSLEDVFLEEYKEK